MLFVALAKGRGTATPRERIARRLDYHYPEGFRVLGEYWPAAGADPAVVLIAEADDIRTVMTAVNDWKVVFDITVSPAVAAEEGIRMAKERLAAQALPLAPEQVAEPTLR